MTNLQEMTKIQENLIEERDKCIDAKQSMDGIQSEAWDRAEALFQRDYYIMTIICFYEAGSCPDIEIAYVCNVIENRILSPRYAYANSASDVVWAEGQYSPTWNTPMNRTSAKVQRVVKSYLRGEIETNMPEDVLYQSRKQQGRIWKHMPSGHYFCYWYR